MSSLHLNQQFDEELQELHNENQQLTQKNENNQKSIQDAQFTADEYETAMDLLQQAMMSQKSTVQLKFCHQLESQLFRSSAYRSLLSALLPAILDIEKHPSGNKQY